MKRVGFSNGIHVEFPYSLVPFWYWGWVRSTRNDRERSLGTAYLDTLNKVRWCPRSFKTLRRVQFSFFFSLVDRFVDRTADSNNQRESIVESLRFSCTCSELLSDIESEWANFFNSTAIRNYKGEGWKKYRGWKGGSSESTVEPRLSRGMKQR